MFPDSQGDDYALGELSTLSIGVDGSWSAMDVATFYHSIVVLYRVENFVSLAGKIDFLSLELFGSPRTVDESNIIDFLRSSKTREYDANALTYMAPLVTTDLYVRSVRFSSPGVHDLFGAARAIGELGKIIAGIFDLRHKRRMQDVEHRSAIEDLRRKKIENFVLMRRFFGDMNFSIDSVNEIEQRFFNECGELDTLVKKGKISKIGLK